MSGIIDDIIFQTLQILESKQKQTVSPSLIYEIFHKLKVNQRYHIVKNSPQIYQTKSSFQTPEKQFLINLNVKKATFNTKFTAVQTHELSNLKISSKHNDIIVMKQYFKRHRQFPAQANIYINKGRTYLVMNNFLPLNKQLKPSRVLEIYNSFILKNLLNFQNFIRKYIQNKDNKLLDQQGKITLFHKQLQLVRILNTTHSTSNIEIDKTQFKFANSSFQKRKLQLISIKEHIVQQLSIQRAVEKLYEFVPEEVCTTWLRNNYIPFYLENQKKLNNILALNTITTQKRLEDFVYNMVKVDVQEMLGGNKPCGEGGFSYIYGARADITFISSSDMKKLPQNMEKVEQFIAIKQLKPIELKKARNKIEHQKEIVIKMRGSTCQFIPKYYGTQKQSQLHNKLVMELIQGEEIGSYVSNRSQTISLWSKIYLLLNVIHGIRHIINYKIVHLDLKPINILVGRGLITKLIDFGEAYHPQVCPKNYVPGLTFPYTAPQVYIRQLKLSFNKPDNDWQYSEKQDSYAFGVMMYEIMFGGTIFPYSINKFKEVYLKRESLQRFFLAPQRVQDYGEDIIMSNILYMVVRCMDLDPVRRPCFQWIGICLKLILNSYIQIS